MTEKMSNIDRLVIAVTTVAEKQDAQSLARAAILAHVAACVQIDGPIESHYRWQGRVCADAEWRVSFKTVARCLPALKQCVDELHPYEQPQWLVTEVLQSSEGYAAWVKESVDG